MTFENIGQSLTSLQACFGNLETCAAMLREQSRDSEEEQEKWGKVDAIALAITAIHGELCELSGSMEKALRGVTANPGDPLNGLTSERVNAIHSATAELEGLLSLIEKLSLIHI